MKEIISHPSTENHDQMPLKKHHEYVAEGMQQSLPQKSIDTLSIDELGYYIGYLHDCGKATNFNQKYLRTGNDDYQHNHAFISAILAFSVLKQMGASDRETMIACYVIAKHHSGFNKDILTYFGDKINNYEKKTRPILKEGFDNEKSREFLEKTTRSLSNGEFGWDEIESHVQSENLENDFLKIIHRKSNINEEVYQDVLSLWSSLAYFDIEHASNPHLSHTSYRPTNQAVSKFIDSLPSNGELNVLRNEIRNDVISTAQNIEWEDFEVAYLPLPTGGGKTLTGLNAASEILDSHLPQTGENVTDSGRVIYALPFTSIIDQTEGVLRDIINHSGDLNSESLMVKHHYLADTRVSSSGEKADTERFLGESWRSGWILTTFVQLFESLLVPRRGQSSKLPSLKNSIIILDEPQTLPNTWWPLIRRLVRILVSNYNARIISMTATQPYIFDDFETVELPTKTEDYFEHSSIDRVKYSFDESVVNNESYISHDELAQRVYTDSKQNRSTLVVCNTIDSAFTISKELWEGDSVVNLNVLLKEWIKDSQRKEWTDYLREQLSENDIVVGHVSSRHRMKDRRFLLSALSERPKDCTYTLISTQLIEAGVDISFERAYRDFSPLQNIVQTAGRCNREGEVSFGEVSVVQLDHPTDDDGKIPSKAIYERGQGTNLLAKTRNALDKALGSLVVNKKYDQKKIAYDATGVYFDLLKGANVGIQKYVKWVNSCRFSKLDDLSMIDSSQSVDVYCGVSNSEFEELSEMKKSVERYDFNSFEEIAQQNSDMLVSIPVYTEEDVKTAEHAFEKIGENVNQYVDNGHYSFESGLHIPSSTADSRLL